ncbi:MAG: ATP-dependent Clp protease adaptor ClpS [Ignavibacteriales bacterium]|nr:ATP-dependent Clp protease adaptor ClpS [Ignavibacteriales bacterium]
MAEQTQIGQIKPDQEEETIIGSPFLVILFNDDWHSFDEVIVQLVKAIKCSFEKARDFAFEVHVKGKAIIFNGPMQQCLKVTSVLEEIGLNTQIVS